MNGSPLIKYKLLIAYDGTRFSGWQIQKNATSIQTLIETAVATATGIKTKVIGSGRTDRGVHALEQCAHFCLAKKIAIEKLHHSLNGLLPLDIRVLSLSIADPEFHARFSAQGKIYRYFLHTGKVLNPFKRLYSYHLPYPIDANLLQAGRKFFIGEKDFTSFSHEAHRGSAARSAVRHLKRLDIDIQGEEIILEFETNGFLYKMVRNITGTLLDVARGKIPIDAIPEIFSAKDRRAAGTTAPSHGLFLVKVIYS